jgi:hypothetical protein
MYAEARSPGRTRGGPEGSYPKLTGDACVAPTAISGRGEGAGTGSAGTEWGAEIRVEGDASDENDPAQRGQVHDTIFTLLASTLGQRRPRSARS